MLIAHSVCDHWRSDGFVLLTLVLMVMGWCWLCRWFRENCSLGCWFIGVEDLSIQFFSSLSSSRRPCSTITDLSPYPASDSQYMAAQFYWSYFCHLASSSNSLKKKNVFFFGKNRKRICLIDWCPVAQSNWIEQIWWGFQRWFAWHGPWIWCRPSGISLLTLRHLSRTIHEYLMRKLFEDPGASHEHSGF